VSYRGTSFLANALWTSFESLMTLSQYSSRKPSIVALVGFPETQPFLEAAI
jgi:hypothetical protein